MSEGQSGRSAVAVYWGDPITAERQAELEAIVKRWNETPADVPPRDPRPGPFEGQTLSAADVFYLAARTLAGPNGDYAAGAQRLRSSEGGRDGLDLATLNLDRASLVGVGLQGAHLAGASLRGADLRFASLAGANFTRADLWRANLERAHLEGAQLVSARLTWAKLREAHLARARLSQANIQRADLSGADLTGADLAAAHAEGADLTDAQLEGADLTGAHLQGAQLVRARLTHVNFVGAHLQAANLSRADIEGADFRGAHLQAALLFDVIGFVHADFSGAELEGLRRRTTAGASPGSAGEQVAFTGYYPREVTTRLWERLLIFIAVDEPEATQQVAAMAAERLHRRKSAFRAQRVASRARLQRGARLTIAPTLPGFRTDPTSLTVEWTDDAQCYEFRLRAEGAQVGQAVNGFVHIFEGPLLRGEIPVSIFVQQGGQPATGPDRFVDARTVGYRNTFPSYSRRDESVVRAFEAVVEASGDRYLRDVRTLRSGQEWAPALLDFIEEADVFQLFWSPLAGQSTQVEREWRHALTLQPGRPSFIRPVYWSEKPYSVPPELESFNFARLDLRALGLESPSLVSRLFGRGAP